MKKLKEKIKKSRKPLVILIAGLPATGKSTLAISLAKKLDFKVCVGVDEIKEIIKKYDKNPFIHKSSHDCWQLIGDKNKKNILAGFAKYCQGFEAGVMAIIERSKRNGENAIIEGVQLIPNSFKKISGINLLYFFVETDFGQNHKRKIKNKVLERHNRQPDVWSGRKTEMKTIQKYLLNQINCKNFFVLKENSTENLVKNIIKILEENEIF